MKRLFHTAAFALLCAIAVGTMPGSADTSGPADQSAADPLNATYWIEGQPAALVDGQCERPAAPGSAITMHTAIWKSVVYGDLDDDGDEDAALVLIHDPGGSGTFYYAAAALNTGGRYRGTNGILLGDRIAPTELSIRNHRVVIDYTDRNPDEPLSEAPSVHRSMALVVKDGQLLASDSPGRPEQANRGWVTVGHEGRAFKPCDGDDQWWLIGKSPTLKAIRDAYRRVESDPKHYRPVLMALVGEQVDPPPHGFGADHPGWLPVQMGRETLPSTAPASHCCGCLTFSKDSLKSVSVI
jgi:hypothetical protein